jgi:RsiW-degrading membrane proteinase PrsW (M82 family)
VAFRCGLWVTHYRYCSFSGFLLGRCKKQTWLLAGFNEKMIKNKSLLGTITGVGFFLPLGLVVVFNSIFHYANEGTVLVVTMLVLLTAVYIFINKKLLNK